MGKQQVKLLLDYRVSPNKIILGHIDLMEDCEYVFELLDMRIYVEFNHIRRNEKHDDWVVGTLKNIKDRNQLHQMILSQDMRKENYVKSYKGQSAYLMFLIRLSVYS